MLPIDSAYMHINSIKNVKPADTPDSVHIGFPIRDRHSSGPGVAHPARCYLPANSANRLNVGLLGIAARRDCPFHPPCVLAPKVTRLCCSDPHLTVERCYLLRCPVQSGRSSSATFLSLHQRRPSGLHKGIIHRSMIRIHHAPSVQFLRRSEAPLFRKTKQITDRT